MIGQNITGPDGKPLDATKLTPSKYNPPDEVRKLFARVQTDYGIAWRLQHRPFDEFDGKSLLERARVDQQTFGTFVGAEFVPQHKRWRWKGKKNTARNKLIGLLAHMIAGILFPLVSARNSEDEEDKLSAQMMRILVENHLKEANYEMKFLYMALSALVNPAVFVEVEYLVAYQRIKERLADGSVQIIEAIDELLTGLSVNIIPIDQILLADFYTNDIQRQPYVVRINRISWDQARKIYSKRYFEADTGKDLFDYVESGKTRMVLSGQENDTLYDIEWTEADKDFVQVLTVYYRDEDLQLDWVGGVGMFNYQDPYNTNPFTHRRMSLIGDAWKTIPVYPFGKSGFEPIDPTGRFAYYKSGANKEYWDAATQDKMHQLLMDGTYLDVIKPIFIDGISKVDSTVIAPGATVGMPSGSKMTPYQMSPNLPAAMQALQKQESDMSDSTLTPIMQGQIMGKQTAYAVNAALTNAKIMLGLFSFMLADLIRQVGELTVDEIVMHTTQGELDATLPEALNIKYKTVVAKSKDKGRDVTHKIVFTSLFMGKEVSEQQVRDREWALFDRAGGANSDQQIHEVNPYRFARSKYSIWVDPEQITKSAVGLNRDQKMQDIQMMTQPFVYPFVDQKALADEVIEEFGGNDPDRFKKKTDPNEMLNAVMGGGGMEPVPSPLTPGSMQPGSAVGNSPVPTLMQQ